MKTCVRNLCALLVLVALGAMHSAFSTAEAQGTAFTYEGQLSAGDRLASGTFNLSFLLFTNSTGGASIGDPVITNGVMVNNGQFVVTIDFGSGVFTGSSYWLEIQVETNGAAGFTALTPRQALTPAPYAIYAESASNLLGSIPAASFGGTYGNAVALSNPENIFDGNGGGVTNVNAAALNGLNASNLWQTTGNSGTKAGVNFIGTTDYQALELWVNNGRALRLEPAGGVPNVIGGGGSPVNSMDTSIVGSFIGGGSGNQILTQGYYSAIAGGSGNSIYNGASYSAIGGGNNNFIQGQAGGSVIAGGTANNIQGNSTYAFIGGGYDNQIQTNASTSVLAGGQDNAIGYGASSSFIGGGLLNQIQSNDLYSVIGGGQQNQIQPASPYSFIGGGNGNQIQMGDQGSYVGGGRDNYVQSSSTYEFIGGGANNQIQSNGTLSVVTGGINNIIQSNAAFAFIGGGNGNAASGDFGTVPGGSGNLAAAYAFAAGEDAQATNQGSFVWADQEGNPFYSTSNNQFNVRAGGGVRFVTGGAGMTIDGAPVLTGNPSGVTLSGAFSGNGDQLTNINAAQLTSIGNAGGGMDNFFVGPSGNSTTSGSANTAAGFDAFVSNTGGDDDTAYGGLALSNNTTGSYNTAIGYGALYLNTIGDNNTATGEGALADNSIGDVNTATGVASLFHNTSGSFNTADGYQALNANTTGSDNTAIGNSALLDNTNGAQNTATGVAALLNNTTGSLNTADGAGALSGSTTDNGLVAIGYQALQHDNAENNDETYSGNGENTAIGYQALQLDTFGPANTAVGYQALNQNTNGLDNTAVGDDALYYNTRGSANTGNGGLALYYNTTGSNNTAIGQGALYYSSTGHNNTAIGESALYGLGYQYGEYGTQTFTSGSNNIALGTGAGISFSGNESGNIDIGNAGVQNENNIIRIGTSQTATYLAGTVYAGNGLALTSDRVAKENFKPVDSLEVLAKVATLPVTEWSYKADNKDVQHIGPMAQDFQAVFQLSNDDKHISVVDEGGVALAAIQGLNAKLNEKEAEIQSLKEKADKVDCLEKQLNELKQMVQWLAENK